MGRKNQSNTSFEVDMTIAEYWEKYGKEIRSRLKKENESNQLAADALALVGIEPQTIIIKKK